MHNFYTCTQRPVYIQSGLKSLFHFTRKKLFGGSYKRETSCMKLVSCNNFYSNNFLLINTQEKSEALTAVKMRMMMLFWVVTSCRLVGRYQHFREI
jgi:hypothetical protein